jgi:hypothetical protein
VTSFFSRDVAARVLDRQLGARHRGTGLRRGGLGRCHAGGGLGASAWIEQRRGRGDDPRKHGAASHFGAGAELDPRHVARQRCRHDEPIPHASAPRLFDDDAERAAGHARRLDEQRLRSRGDGDAAHDAERQHRVDDPPPPAPAIPASRTRLGRG